MKIIFFVSFILMSYCSFSQTWEAESVDMDLNVTITRIKKVSDGVYSLKMKVTMNLFDEYILSGDIKRFKKGENGQEYCNLKVSGKIKGQDVTHSQKCALKHEGGEILYFDWDEWEDKPEKNPSDTFKKVN